MHLNPQPLPAQLTTLKGLSERLMRSHHENNYGGAVKRLNTIRTHLAQTDFSAVPGFVLDGAKREELIAVNSMLLHELYFDSLGGDGQAPPVMSLSLAASFGSMERWRDEFIAMGRALGGGSGWVLLCYSPRDGRLVNQWAADHTHSLALGTPVLALDMYEHAYHLDHGANADAYVEAFMHNIDWAAVLARYARAVHAASEGLAAPQDEAATAMLLDVRRASVFAAADTMLPGATWRDPADVSQWLAELPRDRAIVTYCVYGHELGRAAALRLRAEGFNARFLEGGIDAWQAAGWPLIAKGEQP
jgi:Fe-Mn family superoxide dismutase